LKTQVSKEVHPSFAIVKVRNLDDPAEYGPDEGRSNFSEELEEGWQLFFPFSSSYVGEPIPCADNVAREPDEEDDEEDSNFPLGDVDCIGFLIQKAGNDFIINSAIHAGGGCPVPPPYVDIIDCDLFDEPMKDFLKRFITSDQS